MFSLFIKISLLAIFTSSPLALAQEVQRRSSIGLSLGWSKSGSQGCVGACDTFSANAGDGIITIQEKTTPNGKIVTTHVISGSLLERHTLIDTLSRHAPLPPFSIKIYNRDGKVLSALSELIPGTGVLIASLHSLQSLQRNSVETAFARAGFRLEDYSAYIFRSGEARADAILLLPNNYRHEYLFRRNADQSVSLQENPRYFQGFEPGDYFYSHQLGIGTPNGETAEQRSVGTAARVDSTHAFLPLGSENFTSPASSGAIVYAMKGNIKLSSDFSNSWRVGGIIECVIPDSVVGGIAVRGAVRVITIAGLQRFSATRISLQGMFDLFAEPQNPGDGVCLPTDRRGGGGARSNVRGG